MAEAASLIGVQFRHEAAAGCSTVGGTFAPPTSGASAPATGDWVYLAFSNVTNGGDTVSTVTYTFPGWERIEAPLMVGSLVVQLHRRKRLATDTSYSISLGAGRLWMAAMFWVRNVPDGVLPTLGTRKTRAMAPTESLTTTAPGAPADPDDLAITYAIERTNLAETADPTVTAGGSLEAYQAQTAANTTTIVVASKRVDTADGTADVVVSYPNSHATNGVAQQIIFPSESVVPPTPTPTLLRRWDGAGLANATSVTPTTVGTGDTPFDEVSATRPVFNNGAIDIANDATIRYVKWTGLDTAPSASDPNALAQVAAWGDSLTASTGTNWPGTTLATRLGIPVSNMGVSGMGTMDIALRQGGLKPLITVSGNSIPASGPVTVTAISPSTGWRVNGTGSFTRTGTLAGVVGTLSHDLVADTWTFTRTTAAVSATPCPAGSEFVGTSLLANHERMISIFWTGRNSLDALSRIPEATAAMVGVLTTSPKRFLVLSMTNTSSEIQGSTNLTNILAMNAGLASAYPSNYLDIRSYLASSQALTDAGISPTPQDTTDLSNNVIPTSLRNDSTHLNAAGYARVAHKVADFIEAKGWA
jgi:hypothetical protein